MGSIISVICTVATIIRNYDLKTLISKVKSNDFEEIFDSLPLKQLVMLGQTCKRMNKVVGSHIKKHYSAVQFDFYYGNSINAYIPPVKKVMKEFQTFTYKDKIKMNAFSPFLKKITLHDSKYNKFNWKTLMFDEATGIIPHMEADKFKSLKEIQLWCVTFTDKKISCIKEILGQLETVQLIRCGFRDQNEDFYVSLLQFCTQMRKLCVEISQGKIKNTIDVENRWLLQKYPKLEHFELCADKPIKELPIFFEQNTNVKIFTTDIKTILENVDNFKNTEAEWNVLSVKIDYDDNLDSSFCNLLNELNELGLFKELHLYFFKIDQEMVNQLISCKGLVRIFIVWRNYTPIDLSPLTNVNKSICVADYTDEIDNLAKNLVNLESIHFVNGFVNAIKPFIRYSPKLNTIVVLNDQYIYDKVIMEELNEERSKLSNAQKVTVYVEENVYLTVKWEENKTNWSFIEVKRFDSYDALCPNFDWIDEVNCLFTNR